MVRRTAAALALAAITFALGIKVGAARDPEPAAAPPPSGVELWETLPPELLANVAEGIAEHISDLQDDLETVQAIQAAKTAETR